jgi:hypothetical protein
VVRLGGHRAEDRVRTGLSPLPGIWPSLHLDTNITLPIGVEAYAAYALRAWLAGEHWISPRTRQFAKWSAIFSFALGMAGQVAYHLCAVGHHHRCVVLAGPRPRYGDQNASQDIRAMGATGTYVRASLPEVATALSILTGESHPLAPEGPRTDINQPLTDP